MNIIEHPNMSGFICPICGTNDDKPITLISISGTEERNKCQAEQVHIDCIDLMIVPIDNGKANWLYQYWRQHHE